MQQNQQQQQNQQAPQIQPQYQQQYQQQYHQYEQQLQQHQGLTDQDIQNQRVQNQNLAFKQTVVEPARSGFPPNNQVLSILQLIALIIMIILFITEPVGENIGIIVFYILFTICKIAYKPENSPKKLLECVVPYQQFQQYETLMKQTNPCIQYQAQAYHMVRESYRSGSGRHRRTRYREVKKVTFSTIHQFQYSSCQDVSSDLSHLMDQSSIVNVKSAFTFYKASQLTEYNYQMMKQSLDLQVIYRDVMHSGEDISYISGIKPIQLVVKNELPGIMNSTSLLICYIFGLSLFYDWYFHSQIGKCQYQIQKIVSSDGLVAPPIVPVMNMNIVPVIAQQQQIIPIIQPQQQQPQQMMVVQQQQPQYQQQQQVIYPQQQQQQMYQMPQQQQQQQSYNSNLYPQQYQQQQIHYPQQQPQQYQYQGIELQQQQQQPQQQEQEQQPYIQQVQISDQPSNKPLNQLEQVKQ